MSAAPAAFRSTNSKPKFDSPQQEAFLNLWRTYDRLKVLEDELFGPVGISAQQYNTLRLLQSVYPESLPTLAIGARLISRAPDMTRLLDKLEQRGLLQRERRPENRRVVEVTISPAGLDLLKELDKPVLECHRKQLGHLDAKSLKELARLLQAARAPHEDAENLSLVDAP
ncbi:MAG: MarR family transcriptional regulator [Planctomycetaceae bacterium]|nr:MarR family transcriptional regulator [Planctomycetaceae bacterium]